jgi:hypothetical protein
MLTSASVALPPGDDDVIPCRVMSLPPEQQIPAACRSIEANPMNAPASGSAHARALAATLPPEHLAVLTGKRWAPGTTVTVGFMESVPAELANRIVETANDWYRRGANVRFALSQTKPMVRVTLQGSGYWSYLGTDVLSIPANEPTLSLQGFSMATPQSEYNRVVKHEFGHTLSAPHEHMRREIVARLDPARTIAYFERTQGWTARMIQEQVLTPLDEASLMGTPADVTSIMAYTLPASITRDGKAVPGGVDINDSDAAFMARVYPGLVAPPPPPKPPGPTGPMGYDDILKWIKRYL